MFLNNMEFTKKILEKLLDESSSENKVFQRNILKEYFQIVILDFIYSSLDYSQLIFYGGSCLAHCFGLPRLSEDLNFVDIGKNIDNDKLLKDLKKYFIKETGIEIKATRQKFRIFLKLPILHELSLADESESDFLFLKLEIFSKFNFCSDYKTMIVPLFKYNKSILIKTFDLSTLMATKIMAVLHRKWEQTNKKGEITIKVKGRDYFDLMWYLDKGVKPNLSCLKEFKDISMLKKELLKMINKLDKKSIQLDLYALIKDEKFVKNISSNLKNILERDISEKL